MEKYVQDNGYGTKHTFEVRQAVFSPYVVWNIRMDDEGLLPFCMLSTNPETPCYVDTRAPLYAVRMPKEDVEFLLHASMRGIGSLRDAKMWVKRLKHKKGLTPKMEQRLHMAEKAAVLYGVIYNG